LPWRGTPSLRGLWIVNWLENSSPEELEKTYVEATYPLTDFRKAFEHARLQGRTGKVLFKQQ
jgi:hypothetical protein